MKSAKVLSCEYDKPYAAKNGDIIHYHRLQLSNGDLGNCGVNEVLPSKISEGTTINYIIDDGRIKLVGSAQGSVPTPKPIPPVQQQAPQKSAPKTYGKTPQDAITFILGYASNRHVAKITATKKDVPLQEMLDEADIIYAHYKKMLQQ